MNAFPVARPSSWMPRDKYIAILKTTIMHCFFNCKNSQLLVIKY